MANRHQDLVIVHPAGLQGKELQVTAYHGIGGGHFDSRARHWKLADQATDWLYGPDLTGDGVPDLLVLVGDRLLLYPEIRKARVRWRAGPSGRPRCRVRPSPTRESPAAAETRRRVRIATASSRCTSLPGGGRVALLQGAQKDGKTVLTVVWRK